MKAVLKMAVVAGAALATGEQVTPLAKVQALLGNLRQKVVAEGEANKKTFAESSKACELRRQELRHDIKRDNSQIESDKANIEQAKGTIKVQNSRIAELTASISKNDADLKAAGAVRANDTVAFQSQEKELVDMAAMLQRAISVLSNQKKQAAALAQLKTEGLTNAIATLVQASGVGHSDAAKLTALMQSNEDAEESFEVPKRSASIISVLEDLLSKATSNLNDIRKAEVAAGHNYNMLKASLQDEIKFATRGSSEAQQTLASAAELKSKSEGDLSSDSNQLKQDLEANSTLAQDCATKAQDYEDDVKDRVQELAAIDKAVEILSQSTGAAAARSYKAAPAAASFLQLFSRIRSRSDLARFEAVRMVRDLAEKSHDKALVQLAAQMSAAVHLSTKVGGDPFEKVKGLIKSMLTKLQTEAQSEASQKEFCDKEMGKTKNQQERKGTEQTKLSTKIDSLKSRSATLKQEVVALQAALANIETTQATMDKIRAEEKKNYDSAVPELETGIQGVQSAISVLRDYYAKAGKKAERAGASTGIVGLLEVIEADFSKSLAELKVSEADALKTYKRQSEENKIEKATKGEEVKFRTKETGEVDVAVTQITSDAATVKQELDSINEYMTKLQAQCIAKPETFEERHARRQQEIAGLKNALEILAAQSFLQVRRQ